MRSIYFLSFFLIITFTGCQKVECSKLVFDGVNKLTYKNNQLFSGKCYSYFSESKIESIRQYKDGRDHGKWVFYHQNEKIATKGTMKNGKKIGKWEYFYPTGELRFEHSYNDFGQRKGYWLEISKKGDTLSILKY